METRRLKCFVEIVDAGSINRAATILGVSQPSLSQQIGILERELNTRLLDRSNSGVAPTNAGKALYARARVILRQVADLQSDLAGSATEISGSVSLGLPPSLGAALGVGILKNVLCNYPGLRLSIIEDGAVALSAMLTRGQLDLSVSSVRNLDPDVRAEILFQEDLMLISAADAPPIPADLDALAALHWIVSHSPNAIRGHLGALFAPSDLAPNVIAEVNSLRLVISAVQAGLGVTLLPRCAVDEALTAGLVRANPFAKGTPRRTVYLCTRRATQPTAATEAVRAIVEATAKSIRGYL